MYYVFWLGVVLKESGTCHKKRDRLLGIIFIIILVCMVTFHLTAIFYKRIKTRKLHLWLLPYYNNLHTEYLTSYINTLQLIGFQYFNQCKILQIPPTHNLHNLHAATRHKHERRISQHRGAEKSVAPTDCSTSLWRIIRRIRPNRL